MRALPSNGTENALTCLPGSNRSGCPRPDGVGENPFWVPTGTTTGREARLSYPKVASQVVAPTLDTQPGSWLTDDTVGAVAARVSTTSPLSSCRWAQAGINKATIVETVIALMASPGVLPASFDSPSGS